MVANLDEALRIDPNFPGALGWKAHVDLDSLVFDSIPEREWSSRSAQLLAQAEANAKRALARDPTLVVAYTTLARASMYRWQLEDARIFLERAVQANPHDSVVLHYAAMLHCMLEEPEDAIRFARQALALDPRNPAPYSPLALGLFATGNQVAAAAAARSMIELAPTAVIGYVVLARTQTTGDISEARSALKIAEQFLGNARTFRIDAAMSYARVGAPADAERLVRRFRATTQGQHIDPGLDAEAYIAVGDYANARERIQYAVRHRHSAMDPMPLILIGWNMWSDPVLESAEWRALREQLSYRREASISTSSQQLSKQPNH
jgi:tetratricopeptide (TPR) repeat protein